MNLNEQSDNRLISIPRYFTIFLFQIIFVFAGLQVMHAQRIVNVAPDIPGTVGALNIAIEGDVNTDGTRIDENTIYRLERDGVYWIDGSLENQGYHLQIDAEDGEGHPPIIRSASDFTGSASEILFTVRGDLTVRGLYLSQISDLGALGKNPFVVNADNVRLVIDHCWLDYDEQGWIRLNNSNVKVYVSNTIARNSGRNDGSHNGRILDTRGNNTDTLSFVNNTIYNIQGQSLRPDGAVINYIKMDHNTFVDNSWGFGFDRVLHLEFTNNLFTNMGFRRATLGGVGTDYEEAIFTFLSVNNIDGLNDADRTLIIRNNNFELPIDQLEFGDHGAQLGPHRNDVQTIFDTTPDSLVTNPLFLGTTARSLFDQGILILENNIHESESNLNFADRSDFQTLINFMNHEYFNPQDVDNYPLMWDKPESRVTGSSLDDWRDFTYSTESESYMGAVGGFPIGDLNWYPELKEIWDAGGTITSLEPVHNVPDKFRIAGNYPNPFNPSTNLIFDLANQSEVSFEVFNILGQQVQYINAGFFNAGRHEVRLDASNLMSSGIYIVRMNAGIYSSTHRMTLLK
jgi:hypothetical protein